jgi:hypothetical protein
VSLDGAPAIILNGSAPLGIFRPNTLLVRLYLTNWYGFLMLHMQYQFDGLSSGNHTLTVQNVQDGKYVDLDEAIVSTYSTTKPSVSSSSSDTSFDTSTPTASATHSRHPPKAAVIIGPTIGIAALLLLVFIAFLVYRYWTLRKERTPDVYVIPANADHGFAGPATGNMAHVQISEFVVSPQHPPSWLVQCTDHVS